MKVFDGNKLPSEIMKEDLPLLYAVLDSISYDDAWKCFLEKPDDLTDDQIELLSEIRYLKHDTYGPSKGRR